MRSEKEHGQSSCWNTFWKMQEAVYRCGTKPKLIWVVEGIEDHIESEKLDNDDITIQSLKTGNRSVTDVLLTSMLLHDYLLGEWMESKNFRAEVKAKARAIFKNHGSYREMWNPFKDDHVANTTFTSLWSEVETKLLRLLERCVFHITATDDAPYRQAVRNSNTPQEILSWKPWCDDIADITRLLLLQVDTSTNADLAQAIVRDEPILPPPPSQAASQRNEPVKTPAQLEVEEH